MSEFEHAKGVDWHDTLEAAEADAKQNGKLVLVELYSPKCAGCIATEKNTFSNPEVQQFLKDNFALVHYDVLADDDAMPRFSAAWTPTIIVRNAEGKEQRRSLGYLKPQSFIGEMSLAMIVADMTKGDYEAAQKHAHEAVKSTEGDDVRHPEARYWEAVTAYKTTHSQDPLIAGWKQLLADEPNSDWAKKVEFVKDW